MARAQRQTGLADFGDAPFRPGLQVFLRACAEEAELSWFGHFGTRWDVVRFLSNLLRLRQAETLRPAILEQRVAQPIFITGLPRSGTTFLHKLLAADPKNRVPRIWQTIHPYPPAKGADRRQQRVARQLRMFQLLAPEFRRLHPISADSPQECTEITAHLFASLRFDMTYRVPSYRRWLDATGHLDAYRFHKRFLQHMQFQAGGGGQWVLKCPDHVFALDAIRAVYPDARIVFVHRDPVRALLSVARLTEVLRRPFTRHFDRSGLGREQSERWLAASELMIAAADRQPFAAPIHHVHYRDLVGDPLGAVRALYRHFDIELAGAAAAKIARTVAANPDGGYAANHYRLEDYGFDPAAERERYARYMTRFGIAPEADAAARAGADPAAPSAPRLSAELAK
ncbi:MAG: sulfotransferase family protein [Stellaceae bacterium]